MLPLLFLAPLFLHFLVICRLCSHEGSLLAFKLSLRVIWFCDEHSLHTPFSYRHAAGKMGIHYYMPNLITRLPLPSAERIHVSDEIISKLHINSSGLLCCIIFMTMKVGLSGCLNVLIPQIYFSKKQLIKLTTLE